MRGTYTYTLEGGHNVVTRTWTFSVTSFFLVIILLAGLIQTIGFGDLARLVDELIRLGHSVYPPQLCPPAEIYIPFPLNLYSNFLWALFAGTDFLFGFLRR